MTPTKKSAYKEFDLAKTAKLGGAYSEDDDTHVPDPTHQFGTVDTSGTAGIADSRIEEVTPIFEVSKAQNAVMAARALDPEDNDVDSSLVVLPPGRQLIEGDPEVAKEQIQAKADAAMKDPVEVGGPTMAQRMAAEEGPKAETKAETQRQSQGAGKGVG